MKEQLIEFFYSIGNSRPARAISNKLRGNAAILMYHRVLESNDLGSDTAGLAVSAEYFESHLQLLKKEYSPVSLTELVSGPMTKKLPVALTFDDGYRDNLEVALPLLKKYQIPATFYITTRFADGDTSMWWYELTPLLQPPQRLRLSWKDKAIDLKIETAKEQRRAYKIFRQLFVQSTPSEQHDLLELLKNKSKMNQKTPSILSWEDLSEMVKEPLVTIGSHTANHSVLSQLTEAELKTELEISKNKLEDKLNIKVSHFAYPFGTSSEASTREFEAARTAGYQSGVTTHNLPLNISTADSFALPRIAIKRRTSVKHLKAKLEGWNYAWGGIQI